MNLKDKMKTVGFWMSLVGAIGLLLDIIGIKISDDKLQTIVSAVCGLLVVLGILTNTKRQDSIDNEKQDGILPLIETDTQETEKQDGEETNQTKD